MQDIQRYLEIGRGHQLIVHPRMELCYILQSSIPMINLIVSPGAFTGMPCSHIAVMTTILKYICTLYFASPVPESLTQTSMRFRSNQENRPTHLLQQVRVIWRESASWDFRSRPVRTEHARLRCVATGCFK